MADDILKNIPLPADLPENWTSGQIIAPTGAEAGLDNQHGYNYLMKQVNNAQKALKVLAAQREEDLARIKFWVSNDPTSPASFIGGTWERIEDCTIWGASDTHPAGTTVEAGLPSPWGQINAVLFAGVSNPDNGGFFKLAYAGTNWKSVAQGTYGDIWQSNITIRNNGLFGKSDTVQPPAYCMYIWRRVA